MNPKSIEALVIDDHLGELSPEASELLQNYLATHPEDLLLANKVLNTIKIAQQALNTSSAPLPVAPPRRTIPTWVAKAAAVILLTALGAGAGFIAGRSQSPPPVVASAPQKWRTDSPWARYRITTDPTHGKLSLVRIDSTDTQP